MEISDNGLVVFKKGLLQPGETNDRMKVNSNEEGLDPGDGGGGGGTYYPPNYCDDASKLNLYLSGWYTGNLSAIESWARGTPEIRMRAFAITQNQTKVDVYGDPTKGNLWEPKSRSDIDGTWWNLNDYSFYWNVNNYGEEVTFILHEEDGGDAKDISIPISFKKLGIEVSTTIGFRVDDGDDYVGYFPRRIPFCNGSTIGNETLKFRVYRN